MKKQSAYPDHRYMYIRFPATTSKKKLRKPTTIAWKFDDATGRIVYNCAECSKKDRFSRPIGRSIASSRLENTSVRSQSTHPNEWIPYIEVSNAEGKPMYEYIAMALRDLFMEGTDA